jgi:hypothetical protein
MDLASPAVSGMSVDANGLNYENNYQTDCHCQFIAGTQLQFGAILLLTVGRLAQWL